MGGGGGSGRRLRRYPFQVFSAGGHREQFWHGQGSLPFDVVHPKFLLLSTMAPLDLKGTLRNDVGEAVVTRDMPEPCKIPSLESLKKRFLWASRELTALRLTRGDRSFTSRTEVGTHNLSTRTPEL